MANANQILDKLYRNLSQLGVAGLSRGATSVTAAGLTITYVAASIQAPMGGIDGTVSPYLGIGVANPGTIQIKGAAGQNTIAAIFTSQDALNIVANACSFANDVAVQAGDTTTQLAYLAGHADLRSMGS